MATFTRSGFRLFWLASALCCLAFVSPAARAAEFQARWNELATLLAGYQDVSVVLPGGAVVTGDLLTVREDSLNLDVRKSSGAREFHKGPASIPRAQVTEIRATKTRGSWGRRMGVTVGLIAGLIGGGEFVGHVATSERSGVPSFFGITVGSTVAGYYLGRARDQHRIDITVMPEPAAQIRPVQQGQPATGAAPSRPERN